MKLKHSFHTYAAITILFWSLPFVLTGLSLQDYGPYPLACIRYAVASLALIPYVLAAKIKPPRLRDIPWFLAAGASGFFLYMIVFNIGSGMVTAATGSLVMTSVPVLTAVLARFIYQERLKAYQWGAVCLEFAGIMLLLLMGGSVSLNVGVLWLALGCLLLSSYNLLQRKLTKTYTPQQTAIYSIFAGTLMLLVFLPDAIRQTRAASSITLVYVGIMGVLCSAVAYVTWTIAFSKAEKASYVSNYMFVTPFLATVWGLLLRGEVPGWPTIVGGAVIFLGALLFYKDSFKSAATHAPEADASSAVKELIQE